MADDPLATFDGAPTLTRRPRSTEITEPWAKIPRQVILCCRDMTCLALYTYLDLRHGANGPPPRGLQYIADHFGIGFNTLREHLAHLVEDGFVRVTPELHTIKNGEAKNQAVVEIVHNPSRKRFGPNPTKNTPRPPRYKKASKYSGGKSRAIQQPEEPKALHKENRTVPRRTQDIQSDMSSENHSHLDAKIAGHGQRAGEEHEQREDHDERQTRILNTEAELIASLERAFGELVVVS